MFFFFCLLIFFLFRPFLPLLSLPIFGAPLQFFPVLFPKLFLYPSIRLVVSSRRRKKIKVSNKMAFCYCSRATATDCSLCTLLEGRSSFFFFVVIVVVVVTKMKKIDDHRRHRHMKPTKQASI